MPNPYHDAEGKFSSRDEMVAAIVDAKQQGNVEVYLSLQKELDEIDKNRNKNLIATLDIKKNMYGGYESEQTIFADLKASSFDKQILTNEKLRSVIISEITPEPGKKNWIRKASDILKNVEDEELREIAFRNLTHKASELQALNGLTLNPHVKTLEAKNLIEKHLLRGTKKLSYDAPALLVPVNLKALAKVNTPLAQAYKEIEEARLSSDSEKYSKMVESSKVLNNRERIKNAKNNYKSVKKLIKTETLPPGASTTYQTSLEASLVGLDATPSAWKKIKKQENVAPLYPSTAKRLKRAEIYINAALLYEKL